MSKSKSHLSPPDQSHRSTSPFLVMQSESQESTTSLSQLEPHVHGVSLTRAASDQIRSMLSNEPDGDSKGLRVFIEQGGCSGMKYSMTFDIPRDGDVIAQNNQMRVLVDPISVQYLEGAVIDFSEDLTSGGFKIRNPQAKQSCGCGKSFEV